MITMYYFFCCFGSCFDISDSFNTYFPTITVNIENTTPNITFLSSNSFFFNYPCSSTEICFPYEVILPAGYYRVECWGAQGGSGYYFNNSIASSGGKGAYTSGILHLYNSSTLYFYIGSLGSNGNISTFNGGGNGTYSNNQYFSGSGGGATDVRLIKGNGLTEFHSRIMVAGAGGGGVPHPVNGVGGDAGTYEGFEGSEATCFPPSTDLVNSTGGNQNSGGIGGVGDVYYQIMNGTFGYGGRSPSNKSWGGGGGGGYYGGGAGSYVSCRVGTGAGGSSYISGHPFCNSVSINSNEYTTTHDGIWYHFSNYFFSKTIMKSGKEQFPSPTNHIETGHSGFGAVRITILSNDNGYISECYQIQTCLSLSHLILMFVSSIVAY